MNNPTHTEPFKIIGVSVRTTNTNGKSITDLWNLWQRFYAENILSVIPGKAGQRIYAICMDYQRGNGDEYTAMIGCRVKSLHYIPAGLTGREFKDPDDFVYGVPDEIPESLTTCQRIHESPAALKN